MLAGPPGPHRLSSRFRLYGSLVTRPFHRWYRSWRAARLAFAVHAGDFCRASSSGIRVDRNYREVVDAFRGKCHFDWMYSVL